MNPVRWAADIGAATWWRIGRRGAVSCAVDPGRSGRRRAVSYVVAGRAQRREAARATTSRCEQAVAKASLMRRTLRITGAHEQTSTKKQIAGMMDGLGPGLRLVLDEVAVERYFGGTCRNAVARSMAAF